MHNIENLIERVALWNLARYNRQYDHALSERLVLEELAELIDAESVVDMLDSVGDITFVSIGVMWKMGIDIADIAELFERANRSKTLVARNRAIDDCVASMSSRYHLNILRTLQLKMVSHLMFVTCYAVLRRIGLQERFFDVLQAICDSNDTKSTPKRKASPHVKASARKGKNFVPPTEALKALLEYIDE